MSDGTLAALYVLEGGVKVTALDEVPEVPLESAPGALLGSVACHRRKLKWMDEPDSDHQSTIESASVGEGSEKSEVSCLPILCNILHPRHPQTPARQHDINATAARKRQVPSCKRYTTITKRHGRRRVVLRRKCFARLVPDASCVTQSQAVGPYYVPRTMKSSRNSSCASGMPQTSSEDACSRKKSSFGAHGCKTAEKTKRRSSDCSVPQLPGLSFNPFSTNDFDFLISSTTDPDLRRWSRASSEASAQISPSCVLPEQLPQKLTIDKLVISALASALAMADVLKHTVAARTPGGRVIPIRAHDRYSVLDGS